MFIFLISFYTILKIKFIEVTLINKIIYISSVQLIIQLLYIALCADHP